ncbi:MAG: hypothetical protein ACR2KC_02545, partial [Acidimicrobiales bacterium]
MSPVPMSPDTITSIVPVTSSRTPSTAEAYGLRPEDLDELGRQLDDLRKRVADDLGQADVDYIRNVIRWQRGLEVAGRG